MKTTDLQETAEVVTSAGAQQPANSIAESAATTAARQMLLLNFINASQKVMKMVTSTGTQEPADSIAESAATATARQLLKLKTIDLQEIAEVAYLVDAMGAAISATAGIPVLASGSGTCTVTIIHKIEFTWH